MIIEVILAILVIWVNCPDNDLVDQGNIGNLGNFGNLVHLKMI